VQVVIHSVRAFFSPAILGMVTKVYVPVLFPLTFLIALLAHALDDAIEHSFMHRVARAVSLSNGKRNEHDI
jgi:hypothetical protein